MARCIQAARRSTGAAAPRAQIGMVTRARRPSRSPARARKVTLYAEEFADPAPFVTPVPIATPVYLTQAKPPLAKPDLFDTMQAVACIAFLLIVVFALVGPSALAEATGLMSDSKPVVHGFVPLQYRGPLSWGWNFVRSINDW